MLRISLHGRRFVATENQHGVSSSDTVFHYRMDGSVITGTYRGGRIEKGQLIDRAPSADTIDLLYRCITPDGELLAGRSSGRHQPLHLGGSSSTSSGPG
jgi:hypothetical protein